MKNKIFLKRATPSRSIKCIAFTASAALLAVMTAQGIRVRLNTLDSWHFVAPMDDFKQSKLWELLQNDQFKFIAVVTFLVSPTGSNQTFNVPGNWNSGNNKVETIGAGASGGAAAQTGCVTALACGGGGGAYSAQTNITLVPGGTATYQIGTGGTAVTAPSISASSGNAGGDTWFNGATLGASSVGAKGGVGGGATNGAGGASGGSGGAAGSGVGATKNSGGAGGNATGSGAIAGGSGGGGAAGPNGNGVSASAISGASASAGGNADNSGSGSGSGGSAGLNTAGGTGGNGSEFDGTHGCGGGGGGMGGNGGSSASAGAGGNYGGGGGGTGHGFGQSSTSGAGIQGLIVVTNTPATRGSLMFSVMG